MAKRYVKHKTLADLEANDCRWPIGDPKDAAFHFCGEPKLAERSYCEAHWQMAFQPSRSRETGRTAIAPFLRAA